MHPEADSSKNKVLELQSQVIKARQLKNILLFIPLASMTCFCNSITFFKVSTSVQLGAEASTLTTFQCLSPSKLSVTLSPYSRVNQCGGPHGTFDSTVPYHPVAPNSNSAFPNYEFSLRINSMLPIY